MDSVSLHSRSAPGVFCTGVINKEGENLTGWHPRCVLGVTIELIETVRHSGLC